MTADATRVAQVGAYTQSVLLHVPTKMNIGDLAIEIIQQIFYHLYGAAILICQQAYLFHIIIHINFHS